MANITAPIDLDGIGQDGRRFHVPVDGGATIYEGGLVSQLTATGMLVPTSTAASGPAIGKATHNADNATGADGAIRCLVETDRIYRITNGTAGAAFSDASLIGAPVWASDDNTAAAVNTGGALPLCGTFQGMEADGKVRVLVSPPAADGTARIQAGRGTLAAGVLTVNAGITVTATSRVFTLRVTEAGTDGDEIRVPDADRTVGAPGTGSLVFRSFLSGVAATSDTSTFDYLIVG
jgi:hypothetical protein